MYQLLNWRFEVVRFEKEADALNDIDIADFALVVISMVGKKTDYTEWCNCLSEYGTALPVVTISTESESIAYEKFYETKQFHKLLRPVTGRTILAKCRAIVNGEFSDEYETANEKKSEKPPENR